MSYIILYSQDVVTVQPNPTELADITASTINSTNANHNPNESSDPTAPLSSNTSSTATPNHTPSKDLNLALNQVVGEVARKVKKGNKFTDGLDLSMTTDWASELRPSMRKLRQAMDGLLKTARLMHSVQRLQQDMKRTSATLATMYRRDVCFSQAVSQLYLIQICHS